MHFKHKKRAHGEQLQKAAAPQPQSSARRCMICSRHGENGLHLTCRLEDVAVPEVATGAVECCEDLEDEACMICYDTAIPEIHVTGSMLNCPGAGGGEK
ncbi:MAG: hypothetical protein HDQ87_01090 [Clostridia bacterium]|nr:hypothetical protein [Clostridia bacterium]